MLFVDQPLRDQVIDAGHDVVEPRREVVADDVRLVLETVVGGAAVVGQQDRVARAGVHLRAVAAVEAQHIGGRGTAVNGDDQRVALALLVADGTCTSTPPTMRPVLRLPGDLFRLAEGEAASLADSGP